MPPRSIPDEALGSCVGNCGETPRSPVLCLSFSLSLSTDADEKGHRTHVTQHTAPRSRQSERAPSLSTSPSGSSQAIRASAPLNQISGTPRHQAYVTVPCMCPPWAAPQLKVRLIQINWNANEFERTWQKKLSLFLKGNQIKGASPKRTINHKHHNQID